MKKRILAVLLCLCMVLTMLPVSALAAVGGLLNNTPEQNETLLEKLQSFTGESPEEALELLDSMGLLDEDGNLITDQTIDLDGKQHTLEEMEALLEDPSTDLSQVAYADGVPIALGDLKTVIAIERELQHLQETYFSGKTFDGEARENLNSLVTQLQTAGIAFQSAAVGDTHANVPSIKVDGFTASGVDSGEKTLSIPARANQEYSVTVTLDPGLLNNVPVIVSLGRDGEFTEKASVTLNSDNPTGTLTYTANLNDQSVFKGVPLTVNVSSSAPGVSDYAYGELAGAVHFSNAQGFVFESDGQQSDSHTLRLTKTVDVPDLSTKWMQTDWTAPESTSAWDEYKSPDVYFEFMTYVTSSSNEALGITKTENLTANRNTINEFIGFLQGAKGYTSVDDVKDDVVKFSLTVGSLSAHCSYQLWAYAWDHEDRLGQGDTPNMYFLPEEEDAGVDRVDLKTTHYGLTLSDGYTSSSARFSSVADGGRKTTLQFDASTQLGTNAVPEKLEVRDCVYIPGTGFGEAAYNYGMLKDTAVELINDGKAPTLKSATTPSGTYRPGQLVPVVLAFDELVYVSDSASIAINDKEFTPNDLHMSKAGNQLMFWYPVQKVDGAEVTITSLTGITDIFGNAAEINGETAAGATLESARMRDAATGLSAVYENGQATVTVTLSDAYKNKYANYHTPSGDEAKEVPFQAVVTDENGEVIAVQQVYVNEDDTFSTQPFAVAAQNDAMTYTVTLQANEGTREDPNWVDLSYNTALQDSFSVSALVQAATVTVTDDSEGDYELSLADTVRPTLTAKVYGPDGSTLASSQSGTWSSSDTAIATITTEDDYSGQVTLTGRKVGEVTFTFTADNGTPDDPNDDKTGKSQTYTVVAGESIALVIPQGASTIVVRQNAAATVLWSSNASQFAPGADFQYTIEVFYGNYKTEAELEGKTAVQTYTAAKDKNSVLIPENVLSQLSSGETPAYTVRVSMPHPNGSGDDVRLSALAWIVVHPEPATAVLTRPESLYLKDDAGPVEIGWSLENYTRQTATLTILRVTEDSTFETVYEGPLTDGSGTYTLNLSQVEEDNLKDTYQVMLSVDNGQYESPSTDSFPLYVYNADALRIVNSEDEPITELTLDNTSKVDGDLPTDTQEILSMRQELGLLDYIGINYGDYDWNSFKDGIAWATTNEKISVNYKQGGLYEDIQLFDFDTYLPELKMGIATVEGGEAIITATHAATDMSASIPVTAHTLQDQFYLFQVTPAVETTLRYTNGDKEERNVTTNSEGVLALYEPSGIASDVWLNSEVTEGDETTEYLGTIYNYDLQSGEGDARKLQLYPLNTFRLREAAKAELTLVTPDGSPLADSEAIVRGGVYKNGYFCETAGLGTTRNDIGAAGEEQQDTKFTTDENGKLTVYFDFTQFWSEEAGETKDSLPTAEDKIQYVLEVRDIADIENNTYYPLFQMVDGTVSPMQEMRTASGVVVLEKVPQGEANKPFVARQVIDYHLEDGALIDTRYSTGFVGPNYNFQEAVLTTDMLLWGESGDGASYSLTMVDENGYSPEAQVPTGAERYPFTSMPVVENTLTLTEETMTTSGWIPDGEDVGLKTRLTQDGALVQERTMPFRAIDLTDVKPVQEDKNVTGMVATLVDSSGWTEQINFGGNSNSILKALVGDLGELTGPVNTSVFQMLITPSEDPSVFNALIWAGYDSLDLKDVEYKNGVAVSANFMTKGLETDMPSVGDLQQMANGTYDPMAAYDPYQSNRLSDVAGFDFGVQLEGYYEAEIRYNRTSGDWEVYTKGGGFTAGVGMEFGFNVNTVVGIVPVTGSFEVGGAMQLSLQAATRYSEQEGLEWSDSEATAVTDFLTELRLRAYVEAFGGFGFDFSLIALKIGLFGKLDVNSQNRFLSREYLKDENQRQTNGQYLDILSEVGIKFKAVFALISYEKVLASGSFGDGKDFGQWTNIKKYWENTGTGLDSQSRQYAAAASGLREVSSTATLQSRDYLEQYARTWGNTQARMSLFSLDEENGVKNLQTNANPASFPELSDDGQVLVYVSDGYDETTNPAPSIYDSRAHYSLLNADGSYVTSKAFPPDDDNFSGFGDSDVDIAGVLKTDYTGGNATAAAAWVRQSAQIPGKDAGAEITEEEQNLLMNSSEIMVSVWSKQYGSNTGSWTTTRLTENATPDLAPAVAVNGEGKAIVFWRSVYSAAPESGLMDFSSQDQIMYSYYDGTKWSDAKMLYNGANGSVKGLQAAMLNDGTAMAVYTLDRTGAEDGSGQEIGYTIVDKDGNLGTSMLVTSDETLDENPQVAAGSLGDTGDTPECFILGWHSQQEGVSDIQLLAVDGNGVMSNTFPASLSALTSSGQANVSGDFRFALSRQSNDTVSSLKNLTILWSETVSDETTNRLMTAAHSQLKAARLLASDTNDDGTLDSFSVSAPQVVAELPENTLLDHFDAYVREGWNAIKTKHPIKAVIQATYYDQTNPDEIYDEESKTTVALPDEETKLYTATHNFEPYGLEVEAIGVDYANLMAESLTPIQFTVRNTGVNEVTNLTVTLAPDETATLEALAPNESATLTVYHKVGSDVENVEYTIAGNGVTGNNTTGEIINQTGTVYLDYPDIGISQMKVLEENKGQRTIAVTLYNTSDAPLAGSGRTVKVGFYTDSMLEEKASVTYNGNTISDAITISEDDLARIDAGSYTLVLTYDVGSYVKDTLGETEIPESGVYLYADAWAEGTIGSQSEAKRLPEYHSGDNQSAVLLTGAYARTGEMTALDVVLDNSDDTTTATVTLKNNSLQNQADNGTLVALLLDENGNTLDTQTVTENTQLTCEQNKQIPVNFQEKGTDVILLYVPAESTETQLRFSNIDVDLSDFEPDPDKPNEYTYTLQGDAPASTTVIFSSSETVTINGEEQSTRVGSVQVPIPTGSSTITVTMGEKTYHLHLTRSGGGGGGETTYPPTILETEHGTVTVDPTHPRQGDPVTITAQPDEGYEVGEVTVTRPDGSQVELTENSDGTWGFPQPGESVTIAVTFRCDGGELCPSAHLTDVELNAWYHEAVDYVVEYGIMAGVSTTAFQPNGSLTRGQVVQILHNLEGKPEETAEAPFTDTAGHWALEAIAWAAQNNVVAGYDDGTFGPEKLVTREEFAQMMYNYAKFKGYDLTAGGDLAQFPDAGAISDWAETALSWANGKGLINGHDNGTIDPQGNTTRAQAASIMKNFDLKVVED